LTFSASLIYSRVAIYLTHAQPLGQTFRSIDAFTVGAVCKLRKIFTMKNPLNDYNPEDEFESHPPDA